MVHISKGSGKMEGINSINTNSLTIPFCIKMSECKELVCSKCYARRLLKYRASLTNKLELNNELLSSRFLKDSELPIINALYFRFNSFGELINDTHLINLIMIVNRNPNTIFGLWSKRVDLIRATLDKIPSNLVLIYSNPKINDWNDPFPPTPFDKIFSVYNKKDVKIRKSDMFINCGGRKCLECLQCYEKNGTKKIREGLK